MEDVHAPWDYPQRVTADDWKRQTRVLNLTSQLTLSQARKHGDIDILSNSVRVEKSSPTRLAELLRKAVLTWSDRYTVASEVLHETTGRPVLLIDGTAHSMTFQAAGTGGSFVQLETGDLGVLVDLGTAVLVRFFECERKERHAPALSSSE